MTGEFAMQDKRRKLNLAIVVRTRRRRGMPNLQFPPDGYGEMSAGGGEFKGGNSAFEGEVMDDNPAAEVGQDCAAIFIDREQKTALRGEI